MREAASPRRARVVIVAPVHQFDDIRVFHKEAKTLARHGYEVRLLARAPVRLEEDGVAVVPVPVAGHRLLRFALLPGVLVRALAEGGDIYHLHNPDTIPLGFALRLLGRTVVYDTHEDFSRRLLARKWIPRSVRPLLAWGVASAERVVARVVNLSIATQAGVCERLGPRSLLLRNPPITSGHLIDEAHLRARGLQRSSEPFRLVYVGRITRPRGLFSMLDALVLANEHRASRLWLIGSFNEGDQAAAQRHPGWNYVDYLGQLPQAEAFAYVARSDAGLVTILDVGDHASTSANKLFEYQVFGTPFIASDFPGWRNQMADTEAGIFVNPGDANGIADAILTLARDPGSLRRMGAAGRRFVATYNWETESKKLLSAYDALVRSPQQSQHTTPTGPESHRGAPRREPRSATSIGEG